MVLYELFVVAASVHALRTGSSTIPRWVELAAHSACVLAAVVVFATFCHWFLPDIIDNAKFKEEYLAVNNAYGNTTGLYTAADRAHSKDAHAIYAGELRVWLAFLGMVMVTWGYQRFVLLQRLQREWDASLADAKEAWDRDLWNTSDPLTHATRGRKQQLLDIYKEGFMEVAKPLEPYIWTFLLFAPPAVIIATPWCANDPHWPNCQFKSSTALALRPVLTVAVFFFDRERRAELLDVGTLRRKVWQRLWGFALWCAGSATGRADLAAAGAGYKRANFSADPGDVRVFDRDRPIAEPASGDEDGGTPGGTGAGISYQLMDDL